MDSKQLVLDLLSALKEHGVDELEFREGDLQIKLKREQRPSHHAGPHYVTVAHQAPPPVTYAEPAHVQESAQPSSEEVSANREVIKAPMVGTFYRAPTPDAPPFVEEGQEVHTDQPLCIIEAMKQMNRFEVEFPCRIVSILVENATMIEYGQPLFEVERL